MLINLKDFKKKKTKESVYNSLRKNCRSVTSKLFTREKNPFVTVRIYMNI